MEEKTKKYTKDDVIAYSDIAKGNVNMDDILHKQVYGGMYFHELIKFANNEVEDFANTNYDDSDFNIGELVKANDDSDFIIYTAEGVQRVFQYIIIDKNAKPQKKYRPLNFKELYNYMGANVEHIKTGGIAKIVAIYPMSQENPAVVVGNKVLRSKDLFDDYRLYRTKKLMRQEIEE